MDRKQRVYEIVSRIPKGNVTTYKAIARKAGIRNPRLVGYILHKNPDPLRIPCHRVVDAQGNLARTYAFGGVKVQAEKLQGEDVKTTNGRLRLSQYYWDPLSP